MDQCAAATQRDDGAFGIERVVADEFTLRVDALAGAQVDTELAGRARAFALQFHLAFVAFHVDPEAALTGDVGGEIRRKPVGIVQQEQQRAGHNLAARPGHARLELRHARFQRLGKTLFLGAQRVRDLRGALGEFGVGISHGSSQHRH